MNDMNPFDMDDSGNISFGDDTLLDLDAVETGASAKGNVGAASLKASFYTNIAISLYKGETKVKSENGRNGRAGLTKFDDILRRIYEAARQDDPYADQVIYNIHRDFEVLKDTVSKTDLFVKRVSQAKFKNNVRGQLASPTNLPTFDVYLYTDFGKQIFWTLTDADQVIRHNIFLKSVGIFTVGEAKDNNKLVANAFWKIFSHVYQWRSTGVTRNDIKANNARAQSAKEKNEKITLDEGILSGETRSTYAPDIVIKPENDVKTLMTNEEQKEAVQERVRERQAVINDTALSS